ncbi:hypothetical protein [Nocardioides sp. NPDC006273]|uniref:hypothetical protein n=1 Tax=Nocardioides sp. NPDC006273 TaxID=3155598 RepID=UPI0033BDCE90
MIRRATLALALAALALCASCVGDEPQLLDKGDVPAAFSQSEDTDGIDFLEGQVFGTSWCRLGLANAKNNLVDFSGTPVGSTFIREDPYAELGATIFAPGDRYDSVQAMEDEVDAGYQKCLSMVDHPPQDMTGTWSIEKVEDLPAGGFGYRLNDTTENAQPAGVMVFAPTSDGRLAAVGVDYRGSEEPPVDVTELLKKVLERAPDFPAEESD